MHTNADRDKDPPNGMLSRIEAAGHRHTNIRTSALVEQEQG